MRKNLKKVMAGVLSVCLFATNAPEVIELGEVTQLCEVVQAATGKTYSGKCGKNAKWKYNTKTKTLTISGSGAMEDYTDPDTEDVEGNEETEDDFVEKWRPWGKYTEKRIKKVVIGDKITRIGDFAFAYANNLKEVKLGKKVESIGTNAFSECKSLKKITSGDKVEEIERGAFFYCASLKQVGLGKSVKEIGTAAFLCCGSLKKINLKGFPSVMS